MGLTPIDRLGAISRARPRPAEASRLRSAIITMAETLRLAMDSLRAHKLRSFLTLLGVILAVTTLVAVMSIVAGLNFYVADRIANLGANVFLVDRFGIITSEDEWVKAQKRPLLTLEEYEWLRDNMTTPLSVAAMGWVNSDLRYENILEEDSRVTGATANYAEMRNISIAAGRYFTEADELHHSPICVIGADVAKKFFGNTHDFIGMRARANGLANGIHVAKEFFGHVRANDADGGMM